MKLTVKTLKGNKFSVDVDENSTVAQVKTIIEQTKAELPANSTKLIHSGKVLKDDDSLVSCGVKESDFLVVMMTKPKKVVAAPAAAAPAAPAVAATPATPAAQPPAAEAPAAPAAAAPEFPQEVINNLMSMGFPEEEVRHCLRASGGNPDVAVDFLTMGIPEGMPPSAGASSPAAGGPPLQALRSHPQFNDLRRLVQSNPQMLQQVLTQIGQQQPELLQEINANQALFLQMMNEPIVAGAPAAAGGAAAAAGGAAAGLRENPAQMAQIIQNMPAGELQQMAQVMGLSPEQLRTTAQMIGSMPAEQLNQFMQAMSQEGGGGGGGGGAPPGATVLRLTEEEMAAVDRLTEMGFDRSEAAQAFLACDKNEALAANLLMDSMGEGGGGGFFGGPPPEEGDDADDMYD